MIKRFGRRYTFRTTAKPWAIAEATVLLFLSRDITPDRDKKPISDVLLCTLYTTPIPHHGHNIQTPSSCRQLQKCFHKLPFAHAEKLNTIEERIYDG